MVMFEPLIEEGNEGSIHHIILYSCPQDAVFDTIKDSHQVICDDYETNMPSHDCRQEGVWAWAVGQGNEYTPATAGRPLSGDSDFHYAWLEIHYDVECVVPVFFVKRDDYHTVSPIVHRIRNYVLIS